jgi:predicted transglutaminase-like cysteine proteinase
MAKNRLLAFSVLVVGFSCAYAAVPGEMPAGAAIKAPPGFVSFCMRQPAQCRDDRGSGVALRLDPKTRALITRVNNDVNRTTTWVEDSITDSRQEHFDFVKDGKGDCEDMAITKRAMLHHAGIPLHNLRIAIGKNARGELHAVLLVVTDKGDLVLDSPDSKIRDWREARMTWLKRQDGSAMGWQTIPRAT